MPALRPTPLRFAAAAPRPFRHVFAAMTTVCELQFHGVSPAQGLHIATAIEARVAALVRRYNFHSADSWLNRAVNGRQRDRVNLDSETRQVLHRVHTLAQLTDGAFDITVGTLAAPLRSAHSPAEVAAVQRRMAHCLGQARWWLEGDQLHFDNPHTLLDLGGVIKEHAVDVCTRLAREADVTAGLVNFGGDLRAFGRKPDGSRFVVAVPDPRAPEQMLFGMDLHNQALTTSAHYARHRVLQPAANTSAGAAPILSHVRGEARGDTRWVSASVVSDSALLSGIFSTALLLRDSVALPAGCTAVMVDTDGRIATLEGRVGAPVEPSSSRTLSCV